MAKKVLAAMSGGVDSSIAAYLLKEQGYDVVGATMCLGVKTAEEEPAKCCGPDAINDAKKVCQKLGIPHHIMDFAEDLEEKVIKRFIDVYLSGNTPNPCIDCNKYLKFEILLKKALAMGFDYLATGHYACIKSKDGRYLLTKPKDLKKDQTYFLYVIAKNDLKNILFPLCSYKKNEIKDIAKKLGLSVADKEESQDICFVAKKDYPAFITKRVGGGNVSSGLVMDMHNNIIGEHKGFPFYTIGQRKGLGISHAEPLYVVSINAEKNQIIAGAKSDLKARALIAGNLNFLIDGIPENLSAKIRYNHKDAKCVLKLIDDKCLVKFDEFQEAVEPGQSVVFYSGNVVVGGGIIEKVIKDL
ncbi:MAG: tRNA 2-thiouridine(34) synthase MnmA [Actinobacteria bacterium]|nr:tRNA 2-thiouridine(34) synthase MnmA [Actinomycetota bacterium]